MKMLRADLSADGRLDILAKVMPYRGGAWQTSFHHLAADQSTFPQVTLKRWSSTLLPSRSQADRPS